jgi:thiamine-monophosphate kinase
MLDISDGLLRDGGRMARASGVVIEIDPAAVAVDVEALTEALGAEAARDCVLSGGEEHSLLATFPAGEVAAGWRVIGTVRAPGPGEAPRILVGGVVVTHTGWDHFRAD